LERPWFNCSRFIPQIAVLLGVTVLLSSCLDLTVAVSFRTSSSGQVQVDALAYRLAQGIQVLEGSDFVPFPGSRAEWQTLVDQVPGASLVSWTGADEDLGFRSQTVLTFGNARALEGLFVVFKQKLTLLQDNRGRWTITFVPRVPRVTAGAADTRKLWTALWGPVVWTFSFSPPGQPVATRTVPLADLAGPQAPAPWTVTWSP